MQTVIDDSDLPAQSDLTMRRHMLHRSILWFCYAATRKGFGVSIKSRTTDQKHWIEIGWEFKCILVYKAKLDIT